MKIFFAIFPSDPLPKPLGLQNFFLPMGLDQPVVETCWSVLAIPRFRLWWRGLLEIRWYAVFASKYFMDSGQFLGGRPEVVPSLLLLSVGHLKGLKKAAKKKASKKYLNFIFWFRPIEIFRINKIYLVGEFGEHIGCAQNCQPLWIVAEFHGNIWKKRKFLVFPNPKFFQNQNFSIPNFN